MRQVEASLYSWMACSTAHHQWQQGCRSNAVAAHAGRWDTTDLTAQEFLYAVHFFGEKHANNSLLPIQQQQQHHDGAPVERTPTLASLCTAVHQHTSLLPIPFPPQAQTDVPPSLSREGTTNTRSVAVALQRVFVLSHFFMHHLLLRC
jgi:hypothetical protein